MRFCVCLYKFQDLRKPGPSCSDGHGSCKRRLLDPCLIITSTSTSPNNKSRKLNLWDSYSPFRHKLSHYSNCHNRNYSHSFLASELLHLCHQVLSQLAPCGSPQAIFAVAKQAPRRPVNGLLAGFGDPRARRGCDQINPIVAIQETREEQRWVWTRKLILWMCCLLEWVSRRWEAEDHTQLQPCFPHWLHWRLASKQCELPAL